MSKNNVEYRAIARGFLGKLREPGEVFSAPAGLKGTWFVLAETAERGRRPPKGNGAPALEAPNAGDGGKGDEDDGLA